MSGDEYTRMRIAQDKAAHKYAAESYHEHTKEHHERYLAFKAGWNCVLALLMKEFESSQKDCPAEMVAVVDKHFWELLA